MGIERIKLPVVSFALLAVSGFAFADDAPAPPKYTGPSIADIIAGSGLTLTGYADATYTAQRDDTNNKGYNTFALQQAAFTLSDLPTTGFGALVNVVAGQNPYNATGFGSIAPGQNNPGPSQFTLLQAFAQYVVGPLTIQGGKFSTLAGAEVAAPVGNTNTTRSILFAFEPVTNTGVRATYAATETLNLILGVNNGWTASQDTAAGSGKTLEFGLALTPSKTLSWTLQGYYGLDNSNYQDANGPVKTDIGLLDTVVTWSATSALQLVGSVDYGWVKDTSTTPSASWYGFALYANYAFNDQWRVSVRPEYLDDRDGYLTRNFSTSFTGTDQKLKEITATVGFDPIKSFELRVEGRYDDPSTAAGVQVVPKTLQGWVEAIYKF
jgi:hypothetical protein